MPSDSPRGFELVGVQTFQFARGVVLMTRLGVGAMIFLVGSGLYLSVRFGPWWLGFAYGVASIVALGQTLWTFIREAWVVTLYEGDIRAKTYSGVASADVVYERSPEGH